MRLIQCFFALIIFVSCSNSNTNNDNEGTQQTVEQTEKQPETKSVKQEGSKAEQKDLFMNLIRSLEEKDYLYDTVRFKKAYGDQLGYSNNAKTYEKSGYILYEVPVSETAPFYYKKRKADFDIDLSQVEQIEAYYFTSKTQEIKPDGIVEKWIVSENEEAKTLAEKIAFDESRIYVNRGAYVCYLENQIYIFHSRSVAFYDYLQPIFREFVTKVNAIVPYEEQQRKLY